MHKNEDDHRKLTVSIGDQRVTLVFGGESGWMVPFYESVYSGFLIHDHKGARTLEICPVPKTGEALFGRYDKSEKDDEYAWTRERFTDWLCRNNAWIGRTFSDRSIAVRSMNGLLVYSPDSRRGTVYVPQKDQYPYRSLYRLFWIYLAQVLGEAGACFLHAACLEKDGEGFIFIGGTGTGKSTLARLSGNRSALADEAPVISGKHIEPRIYPSPYHQMGPAYTFKRYQVLSGVPIQNLFFVIRDEKTFIEPVSRTEAVAMIMARYILFFFFVSSEGKVKIFDLFHRTCHKLPIYCLHYSMNTDVWKIIPRIQRED